MKKIININLSGRVIPIEDAAYETLQAYIESLRRYFANEEGRDEIINDIESRVAELMNEKVRKGAACVTEADVDEIIASMGRPEDFDADTAEATTDNTQQKTQQDQQYSYAEKKARTRLYRDTSDKFIGGVCSGIGAYLNVDPAIVRILFAIITFGGFGLGFLIYILLWIILPTKDLEGYSGKRLYRNPEDKVIGGVAGGLAAYFNKEAKTIRLIFASPLILSIFFSILNSFTWHYDFDFALNIGFGSLLSTFCLIYVVLWMILPEARSTYEKMEMRGEKVDVNSIRQNVKEGMDNMKDRVKTWSQEVKDSAEKFGTRAKEFADTRGKAFGTEFSETARSGGRGLGHAIGVLFKAFFIFIAGTIAFGIFVALITLLFGGIAWWPINNFLWTSKWQQIYAWGTLIFFLVVPLIAFITWLVRRIINVKSRKSYLGWTFGFLWTLGWVSVVLLVSSISNDFRVERTTETPVSITQPSNGRMIAVVSQPELEYTGSFGWMNDEGEGWDLSTDTFRLSAVKLNIIKSADSLYHVTIRKHGFGRTEEQAIMRADKLDFPIVSNDSVIDLANGYAIDKESKYRFQHVEIEIEVPAGKKIRFDETVKSKLNPISIRINRSWRQKRINGVVVDDDPYYFRSNIDYIMGIDGELKDEAGRSVNNSGYYKNNRNNKEVNKNDYRYNDDNNSKRTNDSFDIKRAIEEERLKKEESEKRIKELEQQQKNSGGAMETMDDKSEEETASITTPALSLIKWF